MPPLMVLSEPGCPFLTAVVSLAFSSDVEDSPNDFPGDDQAIRVGGGQHRSRQDFFD